MYSTTEIELHNTTFNTYFSYILAVSFIDGENHLPVASH
jgi:hypothetical protein